MKFVAIQLNQDKLWVKAIEGGDTILVTGGPTRFERGAAQDIADAIMDMDIIRYVYERYDGKREHTRHVRIQHLTFARMA